VTKSSRGSHHIQPGRPATTHVTATSPAVEEAEPQVTVDEPRPTAFEAKALWVSLLIWLTIFLGLSLTIWLDLIIGLFHTPGK